MALLRTAKGKDIGKGQKTLYWPCNENCRGQTSEEKKYKTNTCC